VQQNKQSLALVYNKTSNRRNSSFLLLLYLYLSTKEDTMPVVSPVDRVREFVKKFDENLEPIIYKETLKTSEEAASAIGVSVAQIAKSILFRNDDNCYALFVAAGDVRIHSKQVKRCLGGKKTKMASPEEVVQVTGFQVGAVCPFALLEDIPIFIDTSLQRFDTVYTAAGIPESMLPISYKKLVHITQGTEIDAAAAE
jgi:Cys-tRNA(Pro) deacylase